MFKTGLPLHLKTEIQVPKVCRNKNQKKNHCYNETVILRVINRFTCSRNKTQRHRSREIYAVMQLLVFSKPSPGQNMVAADILRAWKGRAASKNSTILRIATPTKLCPGHLYPRVPTQRNLCWWILRSQSSDKLLGLVYSILFLHRRLLSM